MRNTAFSTVNGTRLHSHFKANGVVGKEEEDGVEDEALCMTDGERRSESVRFGLGEPYKLLQCVSPKLSDSQRSRCVAINES